MVADLVLVSLAQRVTNCHISEDWFVYVYNFATDLYCLHFPTDNYRNTLNCYYVNNVILQQAFQGLLNVEFEQVYVVDITDFLILCQFVFVYV